MCRFKRVDILFLYLLHHFNTSYVSVQAVFGTPVIKISTLFQYIVCVGSRHLLELYKLQHNYFNTSYVSVQAYFFKLISAITIISIHRMCRFKFAVRKDINVPTKFQYIVCVGSRVCYACVVICFTNFNTSYVSVQDEALEHTTLACVKFQYIVCVGSSKF